MDHYLIVLQPSKTGYAAYSPDVPGCIATGPTVENTLAEMRSALAFHFEGLRETGEPAPRPNGLEYYVRQQETIAEPGDLLTTISAADLGIHDRFGGNPSLAFRAHPVRSRGMSLPKSAVLTLAALLAVSASQAILPGTEPDLLNLSTDQILSQALYRHPDRMISGVAPSGAANVNAQWETTKTGEWFIEQQRGGADLVQAGVVLKNDAVIKQGIQILAWGFAQQGPGGDFPGTGDPLHSTSFFVEAASRAVLLLRAAHLTAYDKQAQDWTPKILAAARWMMKPDVSRKGREKDLEPYTHRFYLRAAALGQASAVTGDRSLAEAAAAYAREGLAKQQADGTNPEKGGFDASYQIVGVTFAERYLTTCQDDKLHDGIKAMAAKALDQVVSKIGPDGSLSTADSTRTGQEESRTGKTKTLDYKYLLQGLVFGDKLFHQPKYHLAAEHLAKARKWL
jgi:predicted RNase H-like HicB family nuclease